MTSNVLPDESTVRPLVAAMAVGGGVALLTGLGVLAFPNATATVATAMVAIYAAIAGLQSLIVGLATRSLRATSRAGHIALGVLFIVASIMAATNLAQTATTLGVLLTVVIGVTWVWQGVVALVSPSTAPSRGWAVFLAVVSIVGGASLLLSPLWGAVTLWWLLGIWLVVFGVMHIVGAVQLHRAGPVHPARPAARTSSTEPAS